MLPSVGEIDMYFLGANIADKSVYFALVAAIAQYLQIQITLPKTPPKDKTKKPSFQDELSRSMGLQMKYVMPVIIFFIAKSFPAVVALYLITSSLFAIGQELYMRRNMSATLPKGGESDIKQV